MSVVISSRRWISYVLLGILASLTITGIVGCGGKEEVDPYVYASLRAVTRGDTLSDNFLYEIDTPQVDFVRGNVAIVRDGNLLEFIVGEDLENNYLNLSGCLLGVQKTFTPSPTHLVIQRIKRGGIVSADSLPLPEYSLPRLLRTGAVDLEIPGAALPDILWNRKTSMETFLPAEEGDDLIQIQSAIESFVYAPRHDLPDSVRANPTEEDMAWYAVFEEATLEMVDLTPGGEYMMHLLLEKDLPLIGCFSMTSMAEYSDRKVEYDDLGHVAGTVRIIWFRFANQFVQAFDDT